MRISRVAQVKCDSYREDVSPAFVTRDVSCFTVVRVSVARVRETVIIAEGRSVGGADADSGSSGLYKVAVTSMHICARIFAWAWDLLVGSAAYPMQQVSLSSAPNPANVKVTKRARMSFGR